MNRLNLNWFVIAMLGSLLMHGLAYGWLLATDSEGHGVVRGVQVTLRVAHGDVGDVVTPISEPADQVEQPVAASAERSFTERSQLDAEFIEQGVTSGAAVASPAPTKFTAPINGAEQEQAAQTVGPEQSVLLASTKRGLAEQMQAITSVQEVVLAEGDLAGEDDVNVSAAANQSNNDNAPPSFALGSNSNPKPKYPYIAQKRGWQGDVLLGVDVKQDGWPQRVTVLESSGFGLLDNAAVATIRDYWQFEPALRFRRPVGGYTQVPISFRLN